MKSRYKHLPDRPFFHFMEPWEGYPNRPPSDIAGAGRHWSDDLIISQSNKRYLHLLGETKLAIGDGFWTVKRNYTESSSLPNGPILFSTSADPTNINWVHGSWYTEPTAHTAHVDNSSFPVVGFSNPTWDLGPKSASAISEMLPNLPAFDGATALGELVSEGLPSLMGAQSLRDRALGFKQLGGEYLNVEFGWKPFVKDVKDFAYVLGNQAKKLEDLLKRSNKLIKRSYRFPVEASQTVERSNFAFPQPTMSLYYHGIGDKTTITTSSREIWVEAAFYYHYPEAELYAQNIRGMLGRARHLYGVRLTPDVIWNLSPWSWAADWFGNIGDIMTNISMFSDDRLAMPYSYLMEKKSVKVEHLLRVKFRSYPGPKHLLTQSFETVSKFRMKSTPYAIGFLGSDLNDRQKAIAAALAASKGGGRRGKTG